MPKDDDDKYFGLASDGPVVCSMGEWVDDIRSSLQNYCGNDVSTGFSYRNMAKNLLLCYFRLNKVDKFLFITSLDPFKYEVEAEWTSEKIIVNNIIEFFPRNYILKTIEQIIASRKMINDWEKNQAVRRHIRFSNKANTTTSQV